MECLVTLSPKENHGEHSTAMDATLERALICKFANVNHASSRGYSCIWKLAKQDSVITNSLCLYYEQMICCSPRKWPLWKTKHTPCYKGSLWPALIIAKFNRNLVAGRKRLSSPDINARENKDVQPGILQI